MCGVFIDRFGKEITFTPVDAEHSTVRLKVALSNHFLGWIFALGDKVKIVGNKDVIAKVNLILLGLVSLGGMTIEKERHYCCNK